MPTDETPDALEEERALRERERATKEHDPHERAPGARASDPLDEGERKPAPPARGAAAAGLSAAAIASGALPRANARLGYRVVRVAPFEEVATHAASELATPCEFLVFTKPLSP